MYKKILVILIGISFIMRGLPMSIYFIGGRQSLPVSVLAFSGLMVVFAGYLIGKLFVKGIGIKEIIAYFSLDFVAILFNLVYSVFFDSVGSTDIIDTFIVGNVLVLAVNPILVYLAIKKDKYISISNKVITNAPNAANEDEIKDEKSQHQGDLPVQEKEPIPIEQPGGANNSEDKKQPTQNKNNKNSNKNKKKSKKAKKNK